MLRKKKNQNQGRKMLKNFYKLNRAIILVVLFLGIDASAVNYTLNEEKTMELPIAADAPTRVSIDGEKIKDVFFYPEGSAEVLLHSSGQLFIVPNAPQSKIYMTIIGSRGSMQDVVFRIRDQQPSSIKFLKLSNEWEDQSDKLQIAKAQQYQCNKCTNSKVQPQNKQRKRIKFNLPLKFNKCSTKQTNRSAANECSKYASKAEECATIRSN